MRPQHLIQSAAQKQHSTARAYEKHMNTRPSDTDTMMVRQAHAAKPFV
jgi:hypothetical protein